MRAQSNLESRAHSPIAEFPPITADAFSAYICLGPRHPPTADIYKRCYDKLPRKDDAFWLAQNYFRLVAWAGTPVLQADLVQLIDGAYGLQSGVDARLSLQRLSLVYVVLALGEMFNMEVGPNSQSSKRYFYAAQECLLLGCFMVYNTTTAVQSLVSSSQTHADGSLCLPNSLRESMLVSS